MKIPLREQARAFASPTHPRAGTDLAADVNDAVVDDILEPANLEDAATGALRLPRDSFAAPTGKLWHVIREECAGLHARLLLARLLLVWLPIDVGGRVRVFLLRACFRIGKGTMMAGTPRFTGGKDVYRNLTIGSGCWFNVGCFFDLNDSITVGNDVSFGHEVFVLTTSHETGPSSRRASASYCKPVTIGDGAWLGSRCTILPGVDIGAGAVVAAGALVHKTVPPNTMVAGVPARAVKYLQHQA
jgi:maltose O-acetyltransferase